MVKAVFTETHTVMDRERPTYLKGQVVENMSDTSFAYFRKIGVVREATAEDVKAWAEMQKAAAQDPAAKKPEPEPDEKPAPKGKK